jgi:predicted nucleotidyltransferase
MDSFASHRKELKELCVRHQVKTLYAFGSVLGSHFHESSDLDLVVDFKDLDVKDYVDNYYDFKFSLQELFDRPVDLLEEKAIKNPYFKQVVDQTKTLVYG